MSGDGAPQDDSPSAGPAGARRPKEAAVALVCLLGLLVAAVAAPSIAGGAGAGSGSDAGNGEGPDAAPAIEPRDDGGEGGPNILDLLALLIPDDLSADQNSTAPACDVSVQQRPTPGREVTVLVSHGGAPVEGATVRFGDERVGRTDAAGTVRARVPYVRELVVTATLPGDVSCETAVSSGRGRDAQFVAAPGGLHATRGAASVSTAGGAAMVGSGAVTVATAAVDAGAASVGRTTGPDDGVTATDDGGTAAAAGTNVSRTLPVDGEVNLTVDGRPEPGAQLPLRATVEGVPMRAATVIVNGHRVGRTDDAGRYVLVVPDDGTEQLRIRVERGAFAGERTLAVRILSARVAPDGLLSLPGRPVTLRADLGEAPARNATVTLDGRRIGTTDDRGRLRFPLPADPLATVTVRARGQTATAGVWLPYAATAVLVGLPALVVVAAGAVGVRRGGTPRGLGGRLGRLLDRLGAVAAAVALRVATGLDRAVTWSLARIRAGLVRVRTLVRQLAAAWPGVLTSVPALLRTMRSRLASLPERLRPGLRALAGWLARAPHRLWTHLRGRQDAAAAPTAPGRTHGPRPGPDPFDLGAAWRTVARRAAPTAWRTRTPREIVALTPQRGLPSDPVDRLATVFEEVEYGQRPFDDDRRDRAADAFATIEAHCRERASEGVGASDGEARANWDDARDGERSGRGTRPESDDRSPHGGGKEPIPATDAGVESE